jgi:uncharacterized protein YegP (UPF0339 family)
MNRNLYPSEELDIPRATSDESTGASSAVARVAKRRRKDAHSRFDIYCAERIRLTSTLFGGGDWHWRLTAASGAVIADCGGYRDEAQCLAAVNSLRAEAGRTTIFRES